MVTNISRVSLDAYVSRVTNDTNDSRVSLDAYVSRATNVSHVTNDSHVTDVSFNSHDSHDSHDSHHPRNSCSTHYTLHTPNYAQKLYKPYTKPYIPLIINTFLCV